MTPQPNLAAGRTRRNIDELEELARDCGWRLSSSLGDSGRYRHPDSPGEDLDIPTGHHADRFAERYDAALARLTPEPKPEPLPSRGLSSQLIRGRSAGHNAVIARHMCHWVQDVGAARAESHRQFHFGDQPGQTGVCPYEAVAAVLSGQPDPRDTAPTAAPVEEPQARAFLQCTYPPSMTLIASGRESFCTDALERWVSEHPLPQYTRAYVVTVAAETICEPGVGVYTVPTAQDGQR